jgi:hypothetical protein
LSGQPKEIKNISNYTEILNDPKKYNFLVEFDHFGFTNFVEKTGIHHTGFFEYISKNDTNILVLDKIGGNSINKSPVLLCFDEYKNDHELKEIDSIGYFISDSNGYIILKVIGKDNLDEKHEMLVFFLVIIPVIAYLIIFLLYGFILMIIE